jgi:CRP-like cAMP-binding protein
MATPRTHHRRAERLTIAHLLVGLAREVHQTFLKGTGRPFGAEIDIVFVAACVSIGDFEARPMSASDVSNYIEMPRATVQRKLSELIRRRVVTRRGNRFVLAPRPESANGFVDRAMRVIKTAQPRA